MKIRKKIAVSIIPVVLAFGGAIYLIYQNQEAEGIPDCPTMITPILDQCLAEHFPPGSSMQRMRRFLQNNEFDTWAWEELDHISRAKYIRIMDNEINRNRIAIYVYYKNDEIISIKVKQGEQIEGWL